MTGDLARAIAARKDAPAVSLVVVCRDGPRMAALARGLVVLRARDRAAGIPGLGLPALRPGLAACRRAGAAHDDAVAARPCGSARQAVGAADHRQRDPAAGAAARSAWPGNRCRPRPAMCSAWSGSRWLELNGYARASTVREPGDYAVRGGILDLFAPGMAEPVRLDFFGDQLETIRAFDPETQRTQYDLRAARSGAGIGIPAHDRHHPQIPHRLCRGLRRRDARRPALRSGERRPPLSRHGALAAAVPRAHGYAVRLSRRHADRARAAGRRRRA